MKNTNSPDVYQKGYQQALDDFGIPQLLEKLSDFSDSDFDSQRLRVQERELNSLAAMLVQQLTVALKGSLIAGYLNALRHGDGDVLSSLPLVDLQLFQAVELPKEMSPPLFWCGDRLRWKPLSGSAETDFGVAIGRFYLPAPHRGKAWTWKYLILLDRASPSWAWTVADTAWEDDLEPLAEETS